MTNSSPAEAIRTTLDGEHWQKRLADIATRHRIPGAVLAISHGDEIVEAAHGVLNLDTGVETTPDSLFQIGSITKVWTATAIMRLVDQGRLELDAPLIEALPWLRLADPDTTKRVTMRHLLTHTSGIDGDVFTDTGRGDDCLERYVAALADVPSIFPLDATWSYCNSGFSLAGRVIEVVTGKTWDAAMRELLFEPLGLRRTVTLPEEALLHRAAVGHLPGPDGAPRRADRWVLPRSAGPAGLITAAARDLLTFARLHIDGGVAPDGDRLLPADLVEQMRAEQAVLPGPDLSPGLDSWGIGWFRLDWDGHRIIGHDGGTLGQTALLRVLPEQRLAFAMLTNGGEVGPAMSEVCAEVAALVGITVPEPFAPPAQPPRVDVDRHVGVYERAGARCEVTVSDGKLRMRVIGTGELAGEMPDKTFDLVPVAEDRYLCHDPQLGWIPLTFYRIADGSPFMHFGGRATPKRTA
ncbi:serine hydrolase domain-containing protein [Nocardia arthritidis]|uniref:Serine hydrolase n=1 Tax=Nocardia arthritidis TaxID=228602 RepID=A0A6G9YHQ6_9NOCA|nr:serine hydrolase domain-containing protein [Nocardia arthritidis]QIS12721.1 serine hydrolase [Nocardia arthritidis]